MSIPEITIMTVVQVKPDDLALFLSRAILNTYVPVSTPNQPIVVSAETANLLADFANRCSFVTELYNIVLGAQASWSERKRRKQWDPEGQDVVEANIALLKAKIDQLYRTLQALSLKYEATSRQITVVDSFSTSRHRRE